MTPHLPELELHFWYDPSMSGPSFHVVRNATGAFVYIAPSKEAAESWAAERNTPITYARLSDRVGERVGKSLVESMRDHQHHAVDAMRYMMASWPDLTSPPPRPRPIRKWRALRWWLSCRLSDLSDWIAP